MEIETIGIIFNFNLHRYLLILQIYNMLLLYIEQVIVLTDQIEIVFFLIHY